MKSALYQLEFPRVTSCLQRPPAESGVEECKISLRMLDNWMVQCKMDPVKAGAHCRIPLKSESESQSICFRRLENLSWNPGDEFPKAMQRLDSLQRSRSQVSFFFLFLFHPSYLLVRLTLRVGLFSSISPLWTPRTMLTQSN